MLLFSKCPATPCPCPAPPTRPVVWRASAGTEWIETNQSWNQLWNQLWNQSWNQSELFRRVVPFRLRQAHQEAARAVALPRLHGAAAAVAPGGRRGRFEGRCCAPVVRGKLKLLLLLLLCRAWVGDHEGGGWVGWESKLEALDDGDAARGGRGTGGGRGARGPKLALIFRCFFLVLGAIDILGGRGIRWATDGLRIVRFGG